MRKLTAVILLSVSALGLSACGKANQSTPPVTQSTMPESKTECSETSIPTDTEHASANDISFNFETKTVTLNSGYEMPIYGIGTYSLLNEECVNSVATALENGARLIDTAYMYHNEESVGEAVRNSGIPREEIFVTTKLYPDQFANAKAAIDEALEKLDIEYIDLMLLHHPGSNAVDAYHAMETAVSEGKIRSIGLSNWYIEELEEFLPHKSFCVGICKKAWLSYRVQAIPTISKRIQSFLILN